MKNDPEIKQISKNQTLNNSTNKSGELFSIENSQHQNDSIDLWFRRASQWAAVGGTGVASIFFFCFLVWHIIYPAPPDGWLINIIHSQYAATIGVPLSAIAAFCIVTVLNVINNGDVEFSFLGFTFKGASGPVILWVICFLAIILGFHVLWVN